MVGQAPIADHGLLQIVGSVEPKRWPDGKLFDGVGPPDDAHVLVLVRGA